MAHPLYAFLAKPETDMCPTSGAREDITGLMSDPELVRDMCALSCERVNLDTMCYATGKVYDVEARASGACPSSPKMPQASSALDMIRDGYLDLVTACNILPLHEYGMRTRLVHSDSIADARQR